MDFRLDLETWYLAASLWVSCGGGTGGLGPCCYRVFVLWFPLPAICRYWTPLGLPFLIRYVNDFYGLIFMGYLAKGWRVEGLVVSGSHLNIEP